MPTATTFEEHEEPSGILEMRDVTAGYGDLKVIEGVNLTVQEGEFVSIIGPNGAGKSTLMKSIFGATDLMGGTISFETTEISGLDPEEIIRTGLNYVPQNRNIFESLTVHENLVMGAYILGETPEDRVQDVYDRFPVLEERADKRAGSMSGGQRQMLALSRALMLDPDLLLLDEPSAGLAPDLVDELFENIERINDSGTAVLMVEQNAKKALRRSDRGYVLVAGRPRYVDDGDVLLHDEQVRRDFLGS